MKFYKIITASIEMKLVKVAIILTSLAVLTKCERTQQDQFQFPPQLQTPSSGIMVSDSSIYLPPETHTPMPYFTVNNMNKLPFQYLPPSGTKAPSVYPTPYSGIFSSSMRPSFEDDEDDNEHINKIQISSPGPTVKQNHNLMKNNFTDLNQERRDSRAYPKMFSFQQQPQNNIDAKYKSSSFQQVSTQEPSNNNQNSASRRMILTSEIQRNDVSDHLKSYSSSQYPQLPNIFFSSTTEPAIPILRLSNEMDLDGSFSYEALGADQTHYVQHSRMENMGTGKEEQVVEGSYSYVGDNGQTYTVHYVADSNGYRASGDHLPSPPPIPEIIQRAIQYNLAEEARRPPHMRSSWEESDSDKENYNEEDKGSHFAAPPPRSLFTGRTPEAFSFGFSQNSNSPNNQAATSASSYIPKTNFDIAVELSKSKANSSPISPQITFAASQGAHNPSSLPQQTVSRTLSIEKASLPQIMNYEASSKGIDQENKPLWRWQYGMNANTAEQNPNKNTISRSFAEGDDVIINFNDMTPQQYTNMIQNQFLGQNIGEEYHNNKNNFLQSTPTSLITESSKYVSNNVKNSNDYEKKTQYMYPQQNSVHVYENNNHDYFKNDNVNNIQVQQNTNSGFSTSNEEKILSTTTENINTQTAMQNFNKYSQYMEEHKIQPKTRTSNPYPGLIRQQNFMPPSQLVTQSYDYNDSAYESKKVPASMDSQFKTQNNDIHNIQKQQAIELPPSRYWHTSNEISKTSSTTPHSYSYSTSNNVESTNILQTDGLNNFRPSTFINDFNKQESTTTEKNMEDLIRENIFLKNIVRNKKEENPEKSGNVHKVEEKNNLKTEEKYEKPSKHVQSQSKSENDIKTSQKRQMDINDVLNYIAMKNNFELSKTKPKTVSTLNNYQNKVTPVNFIPIRDDKRETEHTVEQESNTHRTLSQKQEELQGMIKNYKVLQRQRNSGTSNQYLDAPQRHVKIFHSDSLPPLGRAGPSMKSYLPPAYL